MLLPIFSKLENKGNLSQPAPGQSASPEKEKSSGQSTTHRPVRRMPGREAFVIPSITEALKDPSETTEIIVRNNPSQNHLEENPFTQEQLVEVWKNFIERIDAPQLKSALSCRLPQLQEFWQITYDLDNELQNQRITLEWKPQLLGYLRQNLRNEKIEVEFKILDLPDNLPSVPYTDAEKWEAMAQKYPALVSLKNRFGLDFQ